MIELNFEYLICLLLNRALEFLSNTKVVSLTKCIKKYCYILKLEEIRRMQKKLKEADEIRGRQDEVERTKKPEGILKIHIEVQGRRKNHTEGKTSIPYYSFFYCSFQVQENFLI